MRQRQRSADRRPLGRSLESRPAQQETAGSLFLPPASEMVALRDAAILRVADVLEPLTALGYRIELARADGRTLPADAALDGRLELRDRRLGKGHLAIEMFVALPGKPSVASLEAVRDKRGRYAQLARYLIVALGRSVPGLQYKATYSALSPEDPALLAATLPDRPDL
jgi:hypothetical protein